MELKIRKLRIIPLTVSQLELYCEDRAALERSLELNTTGITEDAHVLAAYREMLGLCREHPDEYLWYTNWVIVDSEKNRIVGSAGFKGPVNSMLEVEIGYGTDEDCRRQGYAMLALKRMTEWALLRRGVCFVTAQVEPENTASRNLLEKCGYKHIGKAPEGLLYRIERERPVFIAYLLTSFMSIGVVSGVLTGKLWICLAVFIPAGAAAGLITDYLLIKKRKKLARKPEDA